MASAGSPGLTHPAIAALLSAMHAHVASATMPSGSSADAHIANLASAHLAHALAIASDPELRAHLANAQAALHKHLATLSRERAGMMSGKVPARQLGG